MSNDSNPNFLALNFPTYSRSSSSCRSGFHQTSVPSHIRLNILQKSQHWQHISLLSGFRSKNICSVETSKVMICKMRGDFYTSNQCFQNVQYGNHLSIIKIHPWTSTKSWQEVPCNELLRRHLIRGPFSFFYVLSWRNTCHYQSYMLSKQTYICIYSIHSMNNQLGSTTRMHQ